MRREWPELFPCSTNNIALDLINIGKNGILAKRATTEDFSAVQKQADSHTITEYEKCNRTQRIGSNYYIKVKQLLSRGGDTID